MRRLRFLVRKEFQELKRNPRMLRVLLFAPVFQLGILDTRQCAQLCQHPEGLDCFDLHHAAAKLLL